MIDDQKVSLELLSETDLVCLQWGGISNLRLKQTGPAIAAADGMSGLMGIRLVGSDRRRLDFEIWADWFEMSLACDRFWWDHRVTT
ncbi:hypothetical protein [Tessaracoccus massiliensis]|uniref:hypothetical protein n=1 Tax=Tessaracoccus massiliensis TaxID=1522311 RepID=UPI0011CCACD2|nr:hypothetical protein [Tessaracoccus massiliensis]